MSNRPIQVEVSNVFGSDRFRKLRCRNGFYPAFGTIRLRKLPYTELVAKHLTFKKTLISKRLSFTTVRYSKDH